MLLPIHIAVQESGHWLHAEELYTIGLNYQEPPLITTPKESLWPVWLVTWFLLYMYVLLPQHFPPMSATFRTTMVHCSCKQFTCCYTGIPIYLLKWTMNQWPRFVLYLECLSAISIMLEQFLIIDIWTVICLSRPDYFGAQLWYVLLCRSGVALRSLICLGSGIISEIRYHSR
jgi:hypothetical protein